MPTENGYYRHPTIQGNTVVFVTEDDLWAVPAEGGTARRLTACPSQAIFPCLSPDGTRLAYSSRDEGPYEIYVMDAEGGPSRRLTWLGVTSLVAGWSRDGREVLFASDWRRPFSKDQALCSVPAGGGPVRSWNLGPARALSFEPDGPGVVLARNSGDPARWKRYRGGTAGTIWIDRRGDGSFAPLVRLEGNLANPMWVGRRVFFLSDHEGYGNIYSCLPTGRDLRRHTNHEDFYARYPSTDGRRIVYHAGADLFLLDPAEGGSRRIEVRLNAPRTQRGRRFVSPSRYFESFVLHPQGHSVASVHRGGIHVMGLWEGAPLRLGLPSGVRYRLPSWLPDGRRIVAVTDEPGEEGLVLLDAAADGAAIDAAGAAAGARTGPGRQAARGRTAARGRAARSGRGGAAGGAGEFPAHGILRRFEGNFGRAVLLEAAPAGPDRVALTNQRQEVILIDLATGRQRVLERSPYAQIGGLAWSPDGRWLAYGFSDSLRTSSIHLCEVATGTVTAITRSDFNDLLPSFDPEGKYLSFISFRIFDPVYDSHYFDLGFPKGSRPYLIPLKRETVSPFLAANRPPRAPGAPPAEGANDKGKDAPKAPRVDIDLDGIAGRVLAYPVPEGIYTGIQMAKGRAFLSSIPAEGSLDSSWHLTEPPAKGLLQTWSFEEDKLDTVSDRLTDFTLSRDAKVLALRSGNRVRVLPVTYKANGKPAKEEPGRESGWLDLERLRVSVRPVDEWKQMFREAWRLQRDQFWTENMSGIDWSVVHDRYLPLVERCGTRAEFSDLLWEMQGELGTSHCYELGGDYRPSPGWHHGFLGADIDWDARRKAWRITRIPRGDSWEAKYASPLAAPGLLIREGDEILAVDGLPVDAAVSPDERLTHQAGREVRLTVRTQGTPAPAARRGRAARRGKGRNAEGAAGGPKPGEIRTVVVKTLAAEAPLRYRDWVEQNRARVHELSQGRVGYVHVPNMGPTGYAEFHRYYLSEVNRPGLLIDVRFNGGGHVSQLLLEKLARRRIGYDATRWGQPTPYPMDAPMGPMAALTNEYAGSDGDIFSHCFKLSGLGPLIGKRTWGGVVGIWPRHALIDGTLTTQPEFAFWFKDVGWGVENYGTDPDIEVEIRPQDHAAGRDPQLERGVAEVEKLIARLKPKVPDLSKRPKIAPGRLPRVK